MKSCSHLPLGKTTAAWKIGLFFALVRSQLFVVKNLSKIERKAFVFQTTVSLFFQPRQTTQPTNCPI